MVFTEGSRAWRRLLALAAITACVAGASACGSDDDDGGGGASAAPPPASGAEAQIRAIYDDFVAAVADKDADAACETMTDRARKEFTRYELGGKSCESQLLTLMADSLDDGSKPKMLTVKIKGSTALARVRTATGESVSGVRFAKQDGEWKINGSAIAD